MNNGKKLAFAGVYRPRPSPPGFGIPCFADGARRLWVHELEEDKVVGYVRFEADEDSVIDPKCDKPVVVPGLGEPGLHAFHFPDNSIRVESRPELAARLRPVSGDLASTPFVLKEVARFLGDENLLAHAKKLAARKYPHLTEKGGYLSSPAKNGPLGTTPDPVQAKFKVGQSTGGLVVGRNLKLRQGLSVLTTSFSSSSMGTGSGLHINITSKPQPKPRRLVRLKGASGSMAAKPIPRTRTLAKKPVAAKSASPRG